MRKHLPIIVLSALAVVLVGITAAKAYSAMQTIQITGDAHFNAPPENVVVQGNFVSDAPLGAVENPQTQGTVAYTGEVFDLVGTRTGTSVTGVYRGTPEQASTTYPILLNPLASEGVFTIGVTDASSTAALLTFSLLSSNDTSCDTATTTADVGNPILVRDINWFDAGGLLRGASQSNPLTTATTTITMTSATNRNKQIFVENLNSRCLALEVNGSSTAAWIQFKQNSKP